MALLELSLLVIPLNLRIFEINIFLLERAAFDPYKSSFSSTTDVNMQTITSGNTGSSYDFVDKLEELKQKRFVIIENI